MRFTLIFLFLTNCLQIKGQNWVGTNLISWMNIHHPYLPLEYNQLITNNIRLNVSVATSLRGSAWDSGNKGFPTIGKHNIRGFRLSLEPQFFFPQTDRMYIGFDFNMANYNYRSVRGDTTGSLKDPRSYHVWTQARGINCMLGKVNIFGNERLAMIWNGGFGMRVLHVRNDLPIPVNQLSPELRLNTDIEPEENGTHTKFSVALNFKIIVLLGRLQN
jgi:hypothetical protein